MAVESLNEALSNFIAGVTGKGAKYDAKVAVMPGNWKAGLARLDVPVGPVTAAAYEAGIRGKGAKLERNAIAGAKAKWIINYKAGLGI